MKDNFKILDHTADIGIQISASTKEALFISAAHATTELIFGKLKRGKAESIRINVKANDIQDLLVRWLNELIYLADAKGLAAIEFNIADFSENELTATAKMIRADCVIHQLKAATYHKLEIKKTDKGFDARIIFDV